MRVTCASGRRRGSSGARAFRGGEHAIEETTPRAAESHSRLWRRGSGTCGWRGRGCGCERRRKPEWTRAPRELSWSVAVAGPMHTVFDSSPEQLVHVYKAAVGESDQRGRSGSCCRRRRTSVADRAAGKRSRKDSDRTSLLDRYPPPDCRLSPAPGPNHHPPSTRPARAPLPPSANSLPPRRWSP